MIQRILLLLTLLTVGAHVASASTIDYTVNIKGTGSGDGGEAVTGHIFTDGAIGALNQSDITDWVLTQTGIDPAFTLTGPLSGNNSTIRFNRLLDIADPLNASESGQLTWTFARPPATDPSESLAFLSLSQPQQQYGLQFFNSSTQSALFFYSPRAFPSVLGQAFAAGTTIVIGTATVPEPASLTLSALGLAGVVVALRRRSKR